MTNTPLSNRRHVTLFGCTNAGKSTIFNAILGQEAAIVSEMEGTTTDPVVKAMELVPFGPIVLVDTAGFEDATPLSQKRIKKTLHMMDKTDVGIVVADEAVYRDEKLPCDHVSIKGKDIRIERLIHELDLREIPYMLVLNRKNGNHARALSHDGDDVSEADGVNEAGNANGAGGANKAGGVNKADGAGESADIVTFIKDDPGSLENIKNKLGKLLEKEEAKSEKKFAGTFIGDLLPKRSAVFLVAPIDGEAPKGRLILPQVQIIRDCLDHGYTAIVFRDSELSEALSKYPRPDLVITDSQVFGYVSSIVPREIKLTSFSMLFARQKGNLEGFLNAEKTLKDLKPGDHVLIAEACTHSTGHDDIGSVKIPKMLKQKTGGELNIDFCLGQDFPEDLSKYKLIIHCGGCMITQKAMMNRQNRSKNFNVPMINYGILLASFNGILERCCEIFEKKES